LLGSPEVWNEGPDAVAPLPSVTVATVKRSCVELPTVVSHGLICVTVEALPGDTLLLPAEAATKTPARAAYANAVSTASLNEVRLPPIEKLMTSTPSATA
jgi:hypothetical protein